MWMDWASSSWLGRVLQSHHHASLSPEAGQWVSLDELSSAAAVAGGSGTDQEALTCSPSYPSLWGPHCLHVVSSGRTLAHPPFHQVFLNCLPGPISTGLLGRECKGSFSSSPTC